MSEARSVMQDAWHEGLNLIRDAGVQGMITLKGDLSSPAIVKAVKSCVGQAVPDQGTVKSGAKGQVAWMAADELMLFCDYDKADATVAKLDKALAGEHALAVNVSDARAMFRLEGDMIRDLLAKGTPTDLRDFGAGQFRRSRLGQISAAFWMTGPNEGYVVCFRSVGEHMFAWLSNANDADAPLNLY